MKPSVLTILCLASLPVFQIACTADTGDGEASVEEVGANEEALSTKKTFVGQWFTEAVAPGGFARLDLRADGTYAAKRDISLIALCSELPCLLRETGTWTYSWGKLRLKASGEKTSRAYTARRTGTKLSLSSAIGKEELVLLPAGQCVSNLDCTSGEVCPTPVCLMYCEVNDPNCCGPKKCQAAPKPSQCKTNLDCATGQECVEPICPMMCDASEPDCCGPKTCQPIPPPPAGGEACGPVTCTGGKVCCNPLQGICAGPTELCAF